MRVILVGQGPSASGEGGKPFDGRPGAFLAALCGLTLDEFLRLTTPVNLLSRFHGKQRHGKGDAFPKQPARDAARRMLPALRGTLVVAAGKEVAAAFGVVRPEWFQLRRAEGCVVLTIPHPSGINRSWNLPEMKERAGKALREVLGLVRVEGEKEGARPRDRAPERRHPGDHTA